MYNIILSVGW